MVPVAVSTCRSRLDLLKDNHVFDRVKIPNCTNCTLNNDIAKIEDKVLRMHQKPNKTITILWCP